MPPRQTPSSTPPRAPALPHLWLVSDLRTDAALERALRSLPRGAGLIFRHYHLPEAARAARFRALSRLCRRRGLLAVWAGPARAARRHGADGCYGPPVLLAGGPPLLRLVTAHDLAELGAARRARASGVLLSPVFATCSHPGAAPLGPTRWLLLARRSPAPAIALGGVNRRNARRLRGAAWAAIDGLAQDGLETPRIPKDS